MEDEWMKNLDENTKSNFRSIRYMDDVLTVYAKNDTWRHDDYLKDFREQCYFPPLSLETTTDGLFLETELQIGNGNNIRYWLKNINLPGQEPRTWRYAHFSCYSSYAQKCTTLKACLNKVQRAASDRDALIKSGKQKVIEFLRLYYPRKLMWRMCTTMAVNTRDTAWFRVRDILDTT